MMSVAYIAIANSEIGGGHLSRMSSLKELVGGEFEGELICCECVEELDAQISNVDCATVVFDGYDIGQPMIDRFRAKGSRTVLMKDCVSDSRVADVVVTTIPGKKHIVETGNSVVASGNHYLLVANNFTTKSWKGHDGPVFVAFGLSEAGMQLSRNVVACLRDNNPKLDIRSIADYKPHFLSKEEMAQSMSCSSLVIATASTTAIEASVIGTPLVCISMVENQEQIYRGLVEGEYAIGAGNVESQSLEELCVNIENSMMAVRNKALKPLDLPNADVRCQAWRDLMS